MDERQAQIKEGAGLEDSRINTEFLDFLSKWSTPFFVLLLVGAGGMYAMRYFEAQRVAAIDQAYLDYDLTTSSGNPSPASLALLSENYMGTRSVGLMAKLNEADIYLDSARTGLAPSSQLDPETGKPLAEDILTKEQIDSYLESAGKAYRLVLEKAEAEKKDMLAVSGAFGVAAVLGSQGDFAGAKAMYLRAKSIAEDAGLGLLASIARDRAQNIESLPEVTVYDEADLPELPNHDPVIEAITSQGASIGDGTEGAATETAPAEVPAADSIPAGSVGADSGSGSGAGSAEGETVLPADQP